MYEMDLTPLINEDTMDIVEYVNENTERFKMEANEKIAKYY